VIDIGEKGEDRGGRGGGRGDPGGGADEVREGVVGGGGHDRAPEEDSPHGFLKDSPQRPRRTQRGDWVGLVPGYDLFCCNGTYWKWPFK